MKMKKLLIVMIAGAMFAVVACGPSAEEKAAQEQARLDSIAKVEQAIQDSIAAAEAAAAEAAAMDTTAVVPE